MRIASVSRAFAPCSRLQPYSTQKGACGLSMSRFTRKHRRACRLAVNGACILCVCGIPASLTIFFFRLSQSRQKPHGRQKAVASHRRFIHCSPSWRAIKGVACWGRYHQCASFECRTRGRQRATCRAECRMATFPLSCLQLIDCRYPPLWKVLLRGC